MTNSTCTQPTESGLLEYLKKHYQIPDNLPRLFDQENEIIMKEKASLVIIGNFTSKKFPYFF
jgi:ABC-type enterochelin transport system substrate-binding protein